MRRTASVTSAANSCRRAASSSRPASTSPRLAASFSAVANSSRETDSALRSAAAAVLAPVGLHSARNASFVDRRARVARGQPLGDDARRPR